MLRIALQFSQSENSEYTNYAFKNKNCYLVFGSHYNECIGNSGNVNCNFCYACWHNHDLEYCELVFNSNHCFGCVSRSHAEYEILNKKYSKDEYFKKIAGIKDELRREELYGKWLLPSTYPYEDTLAPLYFS